jgi:hypothetical protein
VGKANFADPYPVSQEVPDPDPAPDGTLYRVSVTSAFMVFRMTVLTGMDVHEYFNDCIVRGVHGAHDGREFDSCGVRDVLMIF